MSIIVGLSRNIWTPAASNSPYACTNTRGSLETLLRYSKRSQSIDVRVQHRWHHRRPARTLRCGSGGFPNHSM